MPPSATQVLGDLPPAVGSALPGERSARLIETLARAECPAFTMRRARRAERSGASHDPIVWVEARGSNVVDADGNRFVDLTSGFGAAAVGHAHPRVVEAVRAQAGKLLHALGDVHPSDVKISLLERLTALAPWPDARAILALSGADALEAAIKTAVVATGRPAILAFEGGYHGLGHGPLAACGYSESLRAPFEAQLNPHVTFAPYPGGPGEDPQRALDAVDAAWPREPPGAVIVEPVLGRGGVRVPPPGFLHGLQERCHARGALLIADEVLTGNGRCGARWRSVADGATPDLLCVGKALGGGLPVSACVGRAEVMAAWGTPDGEAIHTGTFFGHPLGCAAALAALDVIDSEGLIGRAAATGEALMQRLRGVAAGQPRVRGVRGVGLLVAVELRDPALTRRLARGLLERGYLTLPCGRDAETLQVLPPLNVSPARLDGFVEALDQTVAAV